MPAALGFELSTQGYALQIDAVPGCPANNLIVSVKINGTECLFSIDTGAESSMIDLNVAKKLKLNLTPSEQNVQSLTGKIAYHATVVRNGVFANNVCMPTLPWVAVDMTSMRETHRKEGKMVVDGVIGMDMLDNLAAVINTRYRCLHIRSLLVRDYKMWDVWEVTAVKPGDAAKAAGKHPTALTMMLDSVRLRFPGKSRAFKATPADGGGAWDVLYLYPDPAPDEMHLCIYRFTGDTLTIAGPLLPGDDPKAEPDSLDPPAKGEPKYSVLTFKRAKPEPVPASPRPKARPR